MLKRMSEYEYHYGLKVRIYPNTRQMEIVSASSAASRFVYNKMVEIGKEIAHFGKPQIYIKVVDERLAWLKELKTSTKLLKDTSPWLREKDVDTMALDNAKMSYNKA